MADCPNYGTFPGSLTIEGPDFSAYPAKDRNFDNLPNGVLCYVAERKRPSPGRAHDVCESTQVLPEPAESYVRMYAPLNNRSMTESHDC